MSIAQAAVGAQALQVEVITGRSQLDALAPAWQALTARLANVTPFDEPGFVSLWWQHFQDPGCQLRIIAVREGDCLVGVLPLYLRRAGPLGLVPTLHAIGQGEAEYEEVCAEYPDLLVLPGMEQAVAAVVVKTLMSMPGWWRLELRDVLAGSQWVQALMPALAAGGLPIQKTPSGVRYWVDLPNSWEEYLGSLKHNYRRKIRLSRRRTEETQALRVQSVQAADEVESTLKVLARLHARRWALVGESGAFVSPRFNQFHEDWARLLLDNDQLRLSLMYIGDAPVAAIYQIHAHGTTYYYQSGVDVENWAAISPGKYMLSLGIEQAIEAGDRIYDFMRGADMSYKKEYGCSTADVYVVRAFRRSAGGMVAQAIEVAKAWVVRLLGKNA